MYLSRFHSLQPTYLVPQAEGLAWLGEAHARAVGAPGPERIAKLIERYGCGPEQIARRGTFLRDFTHRNWDEMQIFGAKDDALGALDRRMAFFREVLLQPVAGLYFEPEPEFKQWVHVTCTGYVSPSLIQTLTAIKGWEARIECLHAYHMGCYAALPALRMVRGGGDADILHTELCTLHLDPLRHEPEQLVIQSLFADGVIRYRVSETRPFLGFECIDARERVVPETLAAMTWDVSSTGFQMGLAREVPRLVEQGVAELVRDWITPDAVYAIHPGGPRIIDAVVKALGLSDEQVHFSREVLRLHGNMSSATLPHVWARLLPELSSGTPVISMAFGPGLTLSASLMRKVSAG